MLEEEDLKEVEASLVLKGPWDHLDLEACRETEDYLESEGLRDLR